jgi:hypothetical protein
VNRDQRVVLVVAAAALCVAIDHATTRASEGWFGYAPGTGEVFRPGLEGGQLLLIRAVLVIAWTLVSLRLLRTRPPFSATDQLEGR